MPRMLSFSGKFRARLVLLSLEGKLADWDDSDCEVTLEFDEFCASPPMLREIATLAFRKLGGGVELFFSAVLKGNNTKDCPSSTERCFSN
ncbi:unnamed protein product [Camellia sinensis]